MAKAQPNAGHLALVQLEGLVPSFRIITQNVDRLHHRAGSRDVIELHGNLNEVRCTRCGQTADRTGEALEALPKCPQCQGLLRPAVVWFNEPLPADAWQRDEHAARSCDLLLVVGTSAVVYPAAGLSEIARRGGASVVEINTERTELSNRVTHGIYGPAGQVLPELVARVGKLEGIGRMIKRTLGKTGWTVNAIGFGAWGIGGQWGPVEETDRDRYHQSRLRQRRELLRHRRRIRRAARAI